MTMKKLKRLCRHVFMLPNAVKRYFPPASIQRIESEIGKTEATHLGEIRFVVEANLPFWQIVQGKTAKKRALEMFAKYHVWDTEKNNGVLIYLLLADHDFEILADRGIHKYVGASGWESTSQQMEAMFRQGEFETGVVFGIRKIGEHLTTHFPLSTQHINELPNKAILI